MKRFISKGFKWTVLVTLVLINLACPVTAEEPQAVNNNTDKTDKLMSRIDFGNSYVMGQTIKSGAVYLMHRKKSEIKSMLKPREDYKNEILEGFVIQDAESLSE